jgi:hypothetical protein
MWVNEASISTGRGTQSGAPKARTGSAAVWAPRKMPALKVKPRSTFPGLSKRAEEQARFPLPRAKELSISLTWVKARPLSGANLATGR